MHIRNGSYSTLLILLVNKQPAQLAFLHNSHPPSTTLHGFQICRARLSSCPRNWPFSIHGRARQAPCQPPPSPLRHHPHLLRLLLHRPTTLLRRLSPRNPLSQPPHVDPPPLQGVSGEACQSLFQQHLKPHVKHAITTRHGGATESDPKYSSRLAGLVLDFFSTAVIDVADELGVPAYVYFPSGAAFLGFLLNLPALDSQLGGLATELTIPSFCEPVPTSVLPSVFLERDQDGYHWMLYHARRFRETKGIIVNSFTGLEPGLADLVSKVDCPPVYPIGPLLDQIEPNRSGEDRIMKWLDDQPVGSVVFLCFGSRGAFGVGQVHEIAHGLEHSGYRFLWSLRQPPRVKHRPPSDHTNFDGVLPEGFLDRTAEKGLVCGWAPQFKILYHPSIGGFVSHGGWNSIMESLWCGVPILVWPIYAEQKLNRYRIVRDLGLGVEVAENDEDMSGRDLLMAYTDGGHLVKREKVKVAVKALMEGESEVRRKVKQMSETCREAVRDGGSSFASLGQFITDLLLA